MIPTAKYFLFKDIPPHIINKMASYINILDKSQILLAKSSDFQFLFILPKSIYTTTNSKYFNYIFLSTFMDMNKGGR